MDTRAEKENVPTRPAVHIDQKVEENLGRVVGVQTEVIQGNVYGGDIHQVSVYVVQEADRQDSWNRFLTESTPPYKFLAAYTARDRALFKGREREVRQVVRHVGETPLLLLHGGAGVGKTSLMAAGVIPELAGKGALVVHVPDYRLSVEATVRTALDDNADRFAFSLPKASTLPDLIEGVVEATGGTFVLVLDQFESFLERAPKDAQRRLIGDLFASTERADGLVRIVVVLQEEAVGQFARLLVGDQLEPRTLARLELLALDREQAGRAIGEPLVELHHPVRFERGLVDGALIPDLCELTPEAGTLDRVHPPHLQIVCSWLYQRARDREPPVVDDDLYVREGKGAPGILASYVRETLAAMADPQAARELLVVMAAPDVETWITTETLLGRVAPAERDAGRLGARLERLVDAGLLVGRGLNGAREYAFVSVTERDAIRQMAGPETFNAKTELERLWTAWLDREALATPGQLRYLADARERIAPSAVQTLLLLRSAVARDEPRGGWLEALAAEEGKALIGQLELHEAPPDHRSSRLTLEYASLLLGLHDVCLPAGVSDEAPFGSVACAAVSHGDPVTRETAALALTVLDRYAAVDRSERALRTSIGRWGRWLRRGELYRNLSDVDVEIAGERAYLPLWDQLATWAWRVRRGVFRDRSRVVWLTLGGALGAGAGLALFRAATVVLNNALTTSSEVVSRHFAISGFYATLLGAAVALGMVLARPLQIERPQAAGETPGRFRPPARSDLRPLLLTVALGTLFFGLAHWVTGSLNTRGHLLSYLDANPLTVTVGFIAGLGLSVALWKQPWLGFGMGAARWVLRLAVVALGFGLAQGVFIVSGQDAGSLTVGLGSASYQAIANFLDAPGPTIREVDVRPHDDGSVTISARAADPHRPDLTGIEILAALPASAPLPEPPALSTLRLRAPPGVVYQGVALEVGGVEVGCPVSLAPFWSCSADIPHDGAEALSYRADLRVDRFGEVRRGAVEIGAPARWGQGPIVAHRVLEVTKEAPNILLDTRLVLDVPLADLVARAGDGERTGRTLVRSCTLNTLRPASSHDCVLELPAGAESYQVRAYDRSGRRAVLGWNATDAEGPRVESATSSRTNDLLALLDAVLMGVVLLLGMMLGMTFAAARLARWQDLQRRAGE